MTEKHSVQNDHLSARDQAEESRTEGREWTVFVCEKSGRLTEDCGPGQNYECEYSCREREVRVLPAEEVEGRIEELERKKRGLKAMNDELSRAATGQSNIAWRACERAFDAEASLAAIRAWAERGCNFDQVEHQPIQTNIAQFLLSLLPKEEGE